MKQNTVAASVVALLLVVTLYGCDSYEAPITGADDTAAELSGSPFTPPSRTGLAKEFNDYNGANAMIGDDYEVTLTIPDGTLFGDKIDTYVWTVEYVGDDANDKINHFAITLDECAAAGFFSNDDGFNSNSSTEFDVQWHPSEGQGGPYVFTGQYPAGQGRWIGYGTAEIKTSGNEKFGGTILLPCMNTATIDASVFFDDDRSGAKDSGEAGQSGITVELRDADNFVGETAGDNQNDIVAIETSGADGVLLFEGVFVDGNYSLALPQSVTDLWLTTNLPDAVNVVGPTPTSSPIGLDKYDVKGFVYAVDGEDLTGLTSVNIELWQDSVQVADATTTASADLNYVLENVFGNLPETGFDEYQVRIPKSTNSALYSAYVPLPGVTTLSDGSAVINGVRVGGEIDAGCGQGNACGKDIGFEPALYDIAGFVSVDPRNTPLGTLDEIVVAGIPDVTVQLLPFEGGVCTTATLATVMTADPAYAVTPDSGDPYAQNYIFADVPAGTYCISIPEITGNSSDYNESLALGTFKSTDVSAEPGAQLLVTVGPDSARNDFPWEAEPDLYTSAFRSNPDYTIFSLGATEWLHKFKTVCRTGDDLIPYKDRFKNSQPPVSATSLISHLNGFLYLTVPPTEFQNACDVADALSQPLAEGRNNVDELSKLYWQLIAAELNFATPQLGLVLNPAGEEDGPIPENMLRYMERFLEQELFGPQTAAKVSSTYSSESGMLSSYNGGGGGGGGTGFE